ncbi:sugar phosphate isomerase/epimerase family protein [Sporosarcina newyorkensis]|uniref:Sugar phosphate isomerase/epimerase n=1 Tax=Sporosarcina newyorkensis TaxID=759851 RepID=A0A1T4YLA1_9BACL|nr:sugar phosphate isomerase/epimerase family protein [Sporosarcina newyorkensis]SKB02604.1 Sugar phosphate isomerase/epimerase [Sporosarcina newyorkensis]
MEYSICSWTFGDVPIDKVMRFVKKTGYDAIEIQASQAIHYSKIINRLSKELNLKVSGLTGDADWPNEHKDLANSNHFERNKAIEYFKKQIQATRLIQGKYLVVCPAAVGKSAQMGKGSEDWNWAIDSVRQLARVAERVEIELIIEPLNRYESCIVNTADDASRFVKEINHPKVKTLIDTYHMNIEEVDMISPVQKVIDILSIVHVADSNRQSLGRGQISFAPFFAELQRLKFNGTIVVECSAPGANPFLAEKDNMDWIYTYAEESLVFLKESFEDN